MTFSPPKTFSVNAVNTSQAPRSPSHVCLPPYLFICLTRLEQLLAQSTQESKSRGDIKCHPIHLFSISFPPLFYLFSTSFPPLFHFFLIFFPSYLSSSPILTVSFLALLYAPWTVCQSVSLSVCLPWSLVRLLFRPWNADKRDRRSLARSLVFTPQTLHRISPPLHRSPQPSILPSIVTAAS
ncbi:uncharacterized protein IWZ02DRAFT_60756 [Phyllosticta citriasiana]|uniref:uncharacterized protein n=1 Tax=Phyllosticta citriasiana TaxID=595635 RepID=UPI0030FD9C6B